MLHNWSEYTSSDSDKPFDTVQLKYSYIMRSSARYTFESKIKMFPNQMETSFKWLEMGFCLDEISFRQDYKSCRIGVVVVVVVVVVVDVIPHLWKLCDGITFVILELHFWDLVHCLLISFCFGSEILKKIGPPQPPQKKQKKTKKHLWIFTMGYLANALS